MSIGYFANKGYCKIYAGNVDFLLNNMSFVSNGYFKNIGHLM